jgi:ketosteroid isomerase-like protein
MRAILEQITEAQNAHDADAFASHFAEGYQSAQPAHPGRAFVGRAQVHENWSSVFESVPDFRAELLARCRDGDDEWGEFDWRGHHTDGTLFAMRGVIIVTVEAGEIAAGRLYMEPVEAVAELFRTPDNEA